MFKYLENKRVLVTGGCGTVGHELAQRLKNISGLEHYVVSRNEAAQFKLMQKYPNVKCVWGDVANSIDMTRVFQQIRPHVVIHAAAVKVVPVAEREMLKTFETNALGTYNIVQACLKFDVESALMIGTDKQCSPINVYGMSKHLGASMFSDANRLGVTKFVSVRYGNVLCSRSSLGVIVMDQAKQGQPLTVTDPDMTRFFFTIQEGVRLIDIALGRCYKYYTFKPFIFDYYGATISTQMCSVRLGDFFEVIAEKFNVPVKVVGRRPGEKTHEHLMADYELKDTYVDEDYTYTPFYAPEQKLNAYVTIPHLSELKGGGFSEVVQSVPRPNKIFSSEDAPKLNKTQIWEIMEYAYNNTWKD